MIHSIPHLHYEVSDWYETNPTPPNPTAKAIRNPLNGIVPFTDISKPETKEIRFRLDDYATPIPILDRRAESEKEDEDRTGLFDFISGKIDVIARVSDDNDINDIGPPEESCGIHRIQYKIFDGFDLSGVILQEGVLFNDTTFRGEHPAFDDEYTPYYFDLYSGCHSVPWTDAFDEYNTRNFEYHYIVTNNTDPSGAKSGLLKEGCWDTEESISVPPPAATPTARIFPDGPYTVLIQSSDIALTPNWSDDNDEANRKTITVKNEYDRVYYVEAGYTPLPAPTPRGSIDNPFGTIDEAIKTPTPGCKILIYLKPGTYHTGETFPIQIPGNFTISGTDHANTVVEGSGSGPVFKFSETNSALLNLTVLYGGSNEEAQVVVEGYDAVIENCRIDGNGAAAPSGIYLHTNWNPKVNNCLILNHSENGILINDVRYPDISNCVFQNNNIGVNANHEATCVLILNSIFDNNTHCAVRAYSISYVGVGYCCMNDSGSPWYDVDIPGHLFQEGILNTNPQFETGSYYLQTSSPCINWGSHSGWMQYGSYTNTWNINAQIFLRTTRQDNQPFPSGLYDESWVDVGFHYKPQYTPTPTPTTSTTPVDTPTPSPTYTPSLTPTPTNTYHPGTGYVTFDFSNYYTSGATAEIMLVDTDLNTDPMTAESYDVDVTSQTDSSGIPMTVTEINVDSNVFTTSSGPNDLGFTSSSSVPYSMIQVTDGDWVKVTYNDSSPPGTITDISWWYGSYPPPTNTPWPTGTPTATPTSTVTPLSGEYFEDFESGTDGWTITGLWHLTSTDSYSPSHSMWYGQEASGDYDTSVANSGAIISPRILLTEDFHLAYYSREETEGTGEVFDTRKVFVSTDNGDSWTLIHQSRNNGNSWFYAGVYDLSPYTGETVRIKFEFDTEDEVDNDHAGWFVDDIIVGHPPLPIPSMGIAGLVILLGGFMFLLRRRK